MNRHWLDLLLAMLRVLPTVGKTAMPWRPRACPGAGLSGRLRVEGVRRDAGGMPPVSPKRLAGLRRRACGVVAGFALGLGLAGAALAADSFLTPLGPVAEAQRTHLVRVVLITMIAIVPVLIGVPLILWRYRRGRAGSAYRPDWDSSRPLEIAMWGVPVVIICVLGVWLWHETKKFDPYRPLGPDPLVVQVVGLDWKWLFIYPEAGVASVGELALPVGRPVELLLTTDTVMQSFFISALAGQIYTMPGMETKLNLRADRPGTALGQNMQYNGDGFAAQKFTLHALSGEDWSDWVAKAQVSSVALTDATYRQLARRGTLDDARRMLAPEQAGGPLLFALAQPDLFRRVLDRYHQGISVAPRDQPGAPAFAPGGQND